MARRPGGEPGPSSDTARAGAAERLAVFRYVVVPNADLYRAIVSVFVEAKSRYRVQLRVEDVARELRGFGDGDAPGDEQLVAALDQLTEWGNLRRTQDTREVASLEEFYHRRSLYQLTNEGEEAHRGVVAVEQSAAGRRGRLSAVMLPAIDERLEKLKAELGRSAPSPARLFTLLKELHHYSTDLADNARRFMNDLATSSGQLSPTDEDFLSYKRAVLAYLDRFIAKLSHHEPRIVATIADIENLGVAAMLDCAATADEAPHPDGSVKRPVAELRERWAAMRAWFCGSEREGPVSELLRTATVNAVARTLRMLERINERRFLRINRSADFMRLAHWFAGAADGDGAHRLFTDAFGLFSARHFHTPSGDEEVERGLSWWQTPGVAVSARLRRVGRRTAPGRASPIADYSANKRAALVAIRDQDAQTARAAERFLGAPFPLSELGHLDRLEFELFLELIDAALRSATRADGTRGAATASGEYEVVLQPPADATGPVAVETEGGRLLSSDFRVTVRERNRRRARAWRRVS